MTLATSYRAQFFLEPTRYTAIAKVLHATGKAAEEADGVVGVQRGSAFWQPTGVLRCFTTQFCGTNGLHGHVLCSIVAFPS